MRDLLGVDIKAEDYLPTEIEVDGFDNIAEALSGAPASAKAVAATIRLIALATFFSGAGLRLCDGLIPRLATDFSLTSGQAGAVITSFSIAYGVAQLLFGPLGDRFGKALLISIALFGCVAGALASALASAPCSAALIPDSSARPAADIAAPIGPPNSAPPASAMLPARHKNDSQGASSAGCTLLAPAR